VRVEYENERERESEQETKEEDTTPFLRGRHGALHSQGLWAAYHMTPPAGASALHSAGFARG
jgi:hypothetical protein